MASRIEANINPELLIWARKSSGLDVVSAARNVVTDPEKLKKWESGELKPSIPQLRKLANKYKRPLAVFFLPEPPKNFAAMRDFRMLPDTDGGEISPVLAYEIRRANQRREVALELLKYLGQKIPDVKIKVTEGEDPDEASKRIRDYLGIDIKIQFSLREKYKAFNYWKKSIEDIGVLVFQTSGVSANEMRGMSISEKTLPVIVLNGQDSPRAKVFTLVHELTHILLDHGGLCNLSNVPLRTSSKVNTEVKCNHIAGAVLIPKSILLKDPDVIIGDSFVEWSDIQIDKLSKKYTVSREAFVRRLAILGIVSEGFYRRKRAEYQAAYARKKEIIKMNQLKEAFIIPTYVMVNRNNGTKYTKIVLDAYYEDKITTSDVSDYLEVKLKHLSSIEHAVLG